MPCVCASAAQLHILIEDSDPIAYMREWQKHASGAAGPAMLADLFPS